jgi:hypothetical protein
MARKGYKLLDLFARKETPYGYPCDARTRSLRRRCYFDRQRLLERSASPKDAGSPDVMHVSFIPSYGCEHSTWMVSNMR